MNYNTDEEFNKNVQKEIDKQIIMTITKCIMYNKGEAKAEEAFGSLTYEDLFPERIECL